MPDYGRYQFVKVEVRDGVATITLNRPERLNAFTAQMHREMEDVFVDVSDDESVRAVVLTGAGRAFCAGGDIQAMRDDSQFHDPIHVMRGPRRLVHNLLSVKQPIICALNGDAVGVGCTIALFCDVIIASENARIGDMHVKVGLAAGDGGAVIWPLLIGPARAKEFLLTGELVKARDAERMGLVNRVVPPDQVLTTSLELARKLAAGPALAIQWTKLAVNKTIAHALELAFDASLALEGMTMASHDHKEGVQAFLEKRPPQYKGR